MKNQSLKSICKLHIKKHNHYFKNNVKCFKMKTDIEKTQHMRGTTHLAKLNTNSQQSKSTSNRFLMRNNSCGSI